MSHEVMRGPTGTSDVPRTRAVGGKCNRLLLFLSTQCIFYFFFICRSRAKIQADVPRISGWEVRHEREFASDLPDEAMQHLQGITALRR